MTKEEICETTRQMCKENGEEFLFIINGKSCWFVEQNNHIRDIANYHKSTEDIE